MAAGILLEGTAAFRDVVRDLKKVQKIIGEPVKSGLDIVLIKAIRKQSELNRLLDKYQNKLKKLQKAQGTGVAGAAARKDLGITSKPQDRFISNQKERVSTMRRELKRATSDVNRFYKDAERRSKGWLNNLSRGNKQISLMGMNLNTAIRRIVTYRVAFAAWRATIETLRDAFTETIKLDSVIQDLKKVMQASIATFDRLSEAAFDFGIKFGRSVFDVVSGFKTFAQQGLSANEILVRMKATMLAVAGSTLTANQAVEALTAVAKNFPEFQDRMTEAVDKWTRVAATAPVTAADLANAVKTVGTAAVEAGLDLDELNGIVAAVAEVTRKSGKEIGNSFKTIFARIPRGKTIKAFQSLGVLALKNSGEMRGFADILKDLNKVWFKVTDVQRKVFAQTIGGIRRYNDFLALMKNFNTFTRETIESQNALGFAQTAAAAEIEKLGVKLQSVQTRFEKFKTSVGKDLVVSFINMIRGLDGTLISLEANSKAIANTIKMVVKFIGVIGKVVIPLALLSVGLNSVGKLLTMTTGRFAAAGTAASGFAAKVSFASRALGVIGLVIGAGVIAYQLWTSASDKAARSADKFRLFIEEQESTLLEYEKQLATATGTLGDFAKSQKIGESSKIISGLEKQIKLLNEFQKSLTATKEISTGKDADVRTVQVVPFKKKAIEERLGKEFASLEAAQKSLLSSGTLLELRKQNAELAIEYENETVALEQLQESQRRTKAFPFLIERGNINDAVNGLKEIRKTITDQFSFNKAKDSIDALIKDTRNLPAGFIDSLKTLDTQIDKMGKESLRLRDQITAIFTAPAGGIDDSTFRLVDRFSNLAASLGNIRTKMDTFNSNLISQRNLALTAGDAFNTTAQRINFYKGKLKEVIDLETKQGEAISKAKLSLSLNNIIFKEEDIVRLLGDELGLLKLINDTINNAPGDQGLERKDAVKRAEKLIALIRERVISESNINALNRENLELLEKAVDLYKQQLTESNRIKIEGQKRVNILKFEAEKLKAIGKGYSSISSRVALTATVVKEIVDAEQKQLLISVAIKQAQIETERESNKALNIFKDTKSIKDKELELNKFIVDSLFKQKTIGLQINAQVLKNIDNIKSAVRSAQISFFAGLPGGLVSRKENLDRLRDDEKAAIEDLKRARISGDTNATNNAIEGLRKIRFEMEKLGTLSVVQPFLQQIMDIRLENLARNFTEVFSGTNNVIAQGITTASVTGAMLYFNAIILASKITADSTIQEVIKASSEMQKAIDEGGLKAAFSLENAMSAGASIAAQLIGQAIGGGGRNSSLFANLGGTFGQAAGRDFLTSAGAFAGPLGALGGSILGGIIGGIFDKRFEPVDKNTFALEKNTREIRNNNDLLSLQKEFLNAPTNFVPPTSRGDFSGGITIQNINITADAATDPDIGAKVATSIADALSNSTKLIGSRNRRFST